MPPPQVAEHSLHGPKLVQPKNLKIWHVISYYQIATHNEL